MAATVNVADPDPTQRAPGENRPDEKRTAHEAFDQLEELIAQTEKTRGPCPLPREFEDLQRKAARFHMEEVPRPLLGEAKKCERLREPAGPHCEDFVWTIAECETAISRLEPAPGRRAMQCLLAKSGTQAMCTGPGIVVKCVQAALRVRARNPATHALCQYIVDECQGTAYPPPRVTPTQCESYLDSVRCWELEERAACLASTCSLHGCIVVLP